MWSISGSPWWGLLQQETRSPRRRHANTNGNQPCGEVNPQQSLAERTGKNACPTPLKLADHLAPIAGPQSLKRPFINGLADEPGAAIPHHEMRSAEV